MAQIAVSGIRYPNCSPYFFKNNEVMFGEEFSEAFGTNGNPANQLLVQKVATKVF